MPGSTALSLVERVKARDPAAWQRLVAVYGPLVYSWARRSDLQAEDAADVVQEVFRAVVTHIDRFRQDRPGDTFHGWLWTIAQNKIRDAWRRREQQPRAAGGSGPQRRLLDMPDPAAGPSSSDILGPVDNAPLLRGALDLIRAEFEERSWQAFWRVTVEGQRPADVAADLHMTPNAVYVARSRILRRLREELGDPPE